MLRVSAPCFAPVRRFPARYLTFFWTLRICFAFLYLFLLVLFLVCRLAWHRWVPQLMLAFSKGEELSPSLSHSRRWLFPPRSSHSFSELPRELSLARRAGIRQQQDYLHQLEAVGQEDKEGQLAIQSHIPTMLFVLLLKWCSKFALDLCKPRSWRAPPCQCLFENLHK